MSTRTETLDLGQKAALLARYVREHDPGVVVETGLWEGWGSTMREPCRSELGGRRVFLIDWNTENCLLAHHELGPYDVRLVDWTILQGDSAVLLPRLLLGIKEPALFWLDAHDDESPTCPLWAELSAIAAHPLAREHVVLVDDWRMVEEGWPGFPTIAQVRELAAPLWDTHIEADVLRLTPARREGGAMSGHREDTEALAIAQSVLDPLVQRGDGRVLPLARGERR